MNKYLKLSLALTMLLAMMFSFNLYAGSNDYEKYNQYLIKSLDDENIGIRTSAAKLLGERQVQDAMEPLTKMLKTEQNYSARIVAAVALYRIGGEKMKSVFTERAKKDKNKTVRHVLAGILQEMETAKLAKK